MTTTDPWEDRIRAAAVEYNAAVAAVEAAYDRTPMGNPTPAEFQTLSDTGRRVRLLVREVTV